MGDRYLTDLADVLRGAGLDVVELDGWKTRARGSGGYDSGRPTHVMVHHTASPPSSSGRPDAEYCALYDEDAPLSNVCLDRDGVWWILAAGATNTNGKGGPIDGVPADSMNSYAIGVEANGGYGDAWPDVQQDSYVRGVAALCDHYSCDFVRGHVEWAPTRKIDPAGRSAWSPDDGTWNLDAFRGDVAACRGGGGPKPEPEPGPEPDTGSEGDEMVWRVAKWSNNGGWFLGDGTTSYWVSDDGGDITTIEAAIRMAPGAVNVKVFVGADSSLPPIVTGWKDVGSVNTANLRRYVGDSKHLP